MIRYVASAALLLTACKSKPPVNVAAMVNNRAITYEELDKNFQSRFEPAAERSSEDQVMIQKLEILRGLIDNEIMLQKAEKLGLMAVDADVETKLNELKAPYTQEEFQKQLAARKMSMDDMKAQLKRDLSMTKLLNKEITSHIAISDKDVTDFYNSNKSSFNFPEPQVHLAQIMVTPQPNPQAHNQNDKAQNEGDARKKIEMIGNRLDSGDDFATLAMKYSEDPETSGNGGDLGTVPESGLKGTDPATREAVMKLKPGQYSSTISVVNPANRQAVGFRIVKLLSKEPAGQRELSDPRVQQAIRSQLHDRREQLLKAAYYEVLRDSAKVENYYAKKVLDRNGMEK